MRRSGTARRRVVLLAGAGLAALVLAAISMTGPNHHHHAARPARHRPTGAAGSPTPTGVGPLTLVAGTRQVNGVALGFPHTLVGAVSAANEYLADLGSTLDPDRAAAIMRLVADPNAPAEVGQVARSVVRMRGQLGLSGIGPLPDGTSFVASPQMYQLRAREPDRVMVLLLATGTYVDAGGGMASTTGVFPMRMTWAAGDWRLSDIGSSTNYSGLNAQPGSPSAALKGWQSLLAAGSSTGGAE